MNVSISSSAAVAQIMTKGIIQTTSQFFLLKRMARQLLQVSQLPICFYKQLITRVQAEFNPTECGCRVKSIVLRDAKKWTSHYIL